MPPFARDLPHLYLPGDASNEPYTSRRRGGGTALPQRDRAAHAEKLGNSIRNALDQVRQQEREQGVDLPGDARGFYLDFEIPNGSVDVVEQLENRQKHIELVAVHAGSDVAPAVATVFVPDKAAEHFLKAVEKYRTEDTKGGKPKNQRLVSRIQDVMAAVARSVFTDAPDFWPRAGEKIWWEVWIRRGQAEAFDLAAPRFEITVQEQVLVFPDRQVRLIYGDLAELGRLFVNSLAIAEVRRAKDSPAIFLRGSNVEQAALANELAGRLVGPEGDEVAVCILDTGMTRTHPLLAPALDPADLHSYDPAWGVGDNRGHGTCMGGTALYGDLVTVAKGNAPLRLTHCLESVKILPDHGENEPRLYGAITAESIARAEVQAPERRRAICMAVTSDLGTNRGRPSSWSAGIDQECFGDEMTRRLIFISAGNIRGDLSRNDYPARNETEAIENPAQAWNAVTVGAYTEKTAVTDPTFAGWEPIAAAGDLCPTSRTSITWERQWPIKPDIVLEGGNWAALGNQCDCPDDLGLLTTYRDPSTRHFEIFRDTSAATAVAGHLAGRILAAMPERWPETIRGLLIHAAEWTPAMKRHFQAAQTKAQKLTLLRKYGYGVPNFGRARFSSLNDLTLIAEDELQPFWKDPDRGDVKTRHITAVRSLNFEFRLSCIGI